MNNHENNEQIEQNQTTTEVEGEEQVELKVKRVKSLKTGLRGGMGSSGHGRGHGADLELEPTA